MLKRILWLCFITALLLLINGTVFAQTPTLNITISSVTHHFNPITMAPGLTLSGITSNIDGARVLIGSGFNSAQDQLRINGTTTGNIGLIAYSYSSVTGILQLNGSDTAENYQAALRLVQYANTSITPDLTPRQITFSLGTKIHNPDNNHYYEFVTAPDISWTAARDAAAALTHFGLQGYLATVTNATENAFIVSRLQGEGWIGGSDEPTLTGQSEGDWFWVTGPEAGTKFCDSPAVGSCTPENSAYLNWAQGEPNNFPIAPTNNENYLHYLAWGQWNDYAVISTSIAGYVVEYGDLPLDPFVVLSDSVTVVIDPVLLRNGSFEVQDNLDPLQPEYWNIVNVTQDVRTCGHTSVAPEGDCMFMFVASPTENTRIQLGKNIEGLGVGNGVNVAMSFKARARAGSVSDARVRLIIEYTDDTFDSARDVVRSTTPDFQTYGVSINATKPIRLIRVQLTNFSTFGRVFIDDVKVDLSQIIR